MAKSRASLLPRRDVPGPQQDRQARHIPERPCDPETVGRGRAGEAQEDEGREGDNDDGKGNEESSFDNERKMKMSETNDSWAIVELMGHVALAGRVTKPGEYGGLWQIDVPEGDTFHTEFFGSQSVYRICMVSEAIARGYARPSRDIIAYDAPIITREEHEQALDRAREINTELREKLWEAERKLLALPAGKPDEMPAGVVETWEDPDEDDD
jgi:hypothetical protein